MAEIKITWYGIVSFDVEIGGKHIIIDPFITDNPYSEGYDVNAIKACDMILLSHGHYDHVTDIPELVKRFDPKIFTGEMTAWSLTKTFDLNPNRVNSMAPGFELDFDWVKVKALYGKHTNLNLPYSQQQSFPGYVSFFKKYGMGNFLELQQIGGFEYRNWIITTPGGKKVLCWGNNPYTEQRNLVKNEHPDIGLLQLTIAPEKIARFAAEIGLKTVIPHHMDLHKTRDEYQASVDKFAGEVAKLDPHMQVIDPHYGVSYEF